MRNTTLKALLYGLVVYLLTFALYYWQAKDLRPWWGNYFRAYGLQPETFEPFTLPGNLDFEDSEEKVFYRGDIERTGFYQEAVSTDLKLTAHDKVTNLEIHRASKSTPLMVDNDYLIPTDSGELVRMTQSSEIIWKYRTNVAAFGFHSTPAIVGNLVIQGDYDGFFAAFNKNSGKMQWGIQLGDTVGASPLVTPDNKILVSIETNTPDGYMAKLDLVTGKIEWFSDYLGNQSHSSPALLWNEQNPGESILLAGDNHSRLSGFRYSDGVRLWVIKLEKPIKSTPALHNGIAYVTSWDGFLYAIEVEIGAVKWKKSIGTYNQSSVAILAEEGLGFFNSRSGLCRFTLGGSTTDLECTNSDLDTTALKSSPSISLSADQKGHLIWSPCFTKALCVYTPSLKLIKRWDLTDSISGEIRPYDGGVIAMTDGPTGLIHLKP